MNIQARLVFLIDYEILSSSAFISAEVTDVKLLYGISRFVVGCDLMQDSTVFHCILFFYNR